MRLSETEIIQIKQALDKFIKNQKAELYLYGSRTDDKLKGGDIDLLILADNPEILTAQKHKILAEIKANIGEQRIDLKITSKKAIKKDAFLQTIMPTVVPLHKWL